ncbi:MAG: hypothetical protein AB7S72_16400 [Draconibacterium sp.]
MKRSGKMFAFLALAVIATFVSCNKNESELLPVEQKTTTADYLALFNAFDLTEEEEITNGDEDALKSAEVSGCLTVIVHENETGEFWPRSWTLDYGTENCETILGNTRRGKINISLSDYWRNEGSFRQITFEDYYFNDNKLEGTKTVANNGENENGNLTFTKKVVNGKLTNTDGTFISWECEKLSEMIAGQETLLYADDVWSVTGSGNGVNIDGNTYSFKIVNPLIYQNGCFYPVSGSVEITTGTSVQVIDYGDGTCDNSATSIVDGVSTVIEL